MRKRNIIFILIILIAITGLIAGFIRLKKPENQQTSAPAKPVTISVRKGDVKKTVLVPGALISTRRAELSFDVSGKLAEVNVRPGDEVHSGDVLVRLDRRNLAESVEQAEMELAIRRIHLNQLLHKPDACEISSAEADLEKARTLYNELLYGTKKQEVLLAEADLKQAEARLEEARVSSGEINRLSDGERASRSSEPESAGQTLNRAITVHKNAEIHYRKLLSSFEAERAVLWAEVRQAEARLKELKAGASQDEIDIAEAQVKLARISLDQARRRLEDSSITAPFDGAIVEVKSVQGGQVSPGEPVVTIIDPLSLEIEASLVEEDIPFVKIGMPVECFFDARPEDILTARVDRIVSERRAGDRPLYTTYIALDRGSDTHDLLPGMTVDASIIVDQRSDVLVIPRLMVRVRPDRTAKVEIWNGKEIEPRIIKVGLSGDINIEVLEGLSEGEEVAQR